MVVGLDGGRGLTKSVNHKMTKKGIEEKIIYC